MSRAVDVDEHAVRHALTAAAERTALLAASIDDTGTPVPHLEWSVGEVAARLGAFCLPACADAVRGREAYWQPFIPRVDGFREPFTGQSVDCHLLGEPVELMLVGYGRRSQWASIAHGRLHAWRRRPWLGLRWKRLYLDP